MGARRITGAFGALLALGAAATASRAQQPFQDAQGRSSIYIERGGFAQINITDSSIRLGYLYDNTKNPYRYGFGPNGRLSGDAAPLFRTDTPAPEAQVGASIGKRWIFARKPSVPPPGTKPAVEETKGGLTYDWATLRVGYGRVQYRLVNDAGTLRSQDFDGLSAYVAYNALYGNPSRIFGIALGVERTNNISDLREVEMREEVPLSTTDGTVRNLVSARRARVGDYKETTDVLLNADYVWFPPAFGSRIGLDAFARWNLTRGSFEPGLGVFITQPNAPTRVVGGLSVSSVDGDLNVGLISGFNF